MRNIYKIILTTSIFSAMFATSAMAVEPACISLCNSCNAMAPGDTSCYKIEATCKCAAFADSIKSANMAKEITKRKLVKEISAGCDKPACARSITFENGLFTKMEKGRTPLSTLQLRTGTDEASRKTASVQPNAVKAANESLDSLERRRSLLPVAPLSMECTERCNTCFAPADSTAKTAAVDSAAQATTTVQPATVTPADSAVAQATPAMAGADSATVKPAMAGTDSAAVKNAEVKSAATAPDSTAKTAAADSAAQATTTVQPAAVTPADSAVAQATPAVAGADSATVKPAMAGADSAAVKNAEVKSAATAPDLTAKTAAVDSAAQATTTVQPAAVTPADSAALAKAQADSLAKVQCKLAETNCQCKLHMDNTAQLVAIDKKIAIQKNLADSLQKNKAAILREEMAQRIADSVQTLCSSETKCSYTVTFTSKELSLLELHPSAQDTAPATIATPATTTPADSATVKPAAEEPAAAPAEACPQPVAAAADTAAKDSASKDAKKGRRIFYKGMDLVYGGFKESNYYTKDYGRIGNIDGDKAIEGGVNYLLRWYFYDGGAISVGLGAFYHYNKFSADEEVDPDGKISILYHNIGVDIPISVRLGVPVIPIFKPFVSGTFNFHKPIYEFFKMEGFDSDEGDGEAAASSVIDITSALDFDPTKMILGDWQHRFNGMSAMEYTVWVGFGLEITHHFSAEYQINLGLKNGGHSHHYDDSNFWRIVIGFAW